MAQGGAYIYYWIAAGLAAYSSYATGKQIQYEHEAKADEEKLAARDREIERRNRLLKAIASRNVASAAGGTALEGTDIALINRDFKEYNLESLSSNAMTRARIESLRAAGASARRIGTIRAVGSVFEAASSYSSRPTTATPKSNPATVNKTVR